MSDDELSESGDLNIGHYEGDRDELERRHGFGKAFFPNGDTYEGEYLHGRRNGKGVYRFASGAFYNGDYIDNKREGRGTFVYPDGSKYDGRWDLDTRHGYGIYEYENGDRYEGEWFRNRKTGTGKYFHKESESISEGQWVDGKMTGQGSIHYGYCNFQGRFNANVVKGVGKFIFPKRRIEINGVYKAFLLPGLVN
eukprot:TCONS_00063293-protein